MKNILSYIASLRSPARSPIISLGRRQEKGDSNQYGYINVTDTFVLSRPTLLCLSGDRTKSSEGANGFAKLGQTLLGRAQVYSTDVQILGAIYPKLKTTYKKLIEGYNQKAKAGNSQNYTDFSYDLAVKQFFPLVSNSRNTIDGRIEYEKISTIQAMRNCRNINVLAYSYGGVVINEIGDALSEFMENIGYTKDEIKKISQQVLVLTGGNVANVGTSKAGFTQIHLFNMNDTGVQKRCQNIDIVKDMLAKENKSNLPLAVSSVKEAKGLEYVVCAISGLQNMIRADDRGDFTKSDNTLMPVYKDAMGHAPDTYFSLGLGQHGFMMSLVAASVLTNGVNHSIANNVIHEGEEFSPLPSPEYLLKAPQQIRFAKATRGQAGTYAELLRLADAIEYDRRIRSAWER